MPVGGLGAAVEAKNAIRTSIKGLFPDRDCATLVRPMHDERVSGDGALVAGLLQWRVMRQATVASGCNANP